MAEQHWVKYYKIKPENIHDDGTIDDDTPLYPYYSGSYHVNGPTERFNESIEYDQTSNTDHGLKNGRRLKDLRTGEEFETGLKRGFSVNGYVKGADGMLWTPAGDDSGAVIDPASEKYSTIPSEGYTDSVFNDKLDIVSDLTLPLNYDHKFVVLPTIVTADDDDLVRYYDYKYNGYNPERDSRNEQMLKRIKYRRLPEGFKYKITKNDYDTSSIYLSAFNLVSKLKQDLRIKNKKDCARDFGYNISDRLINGKNTLMSLARRYDSILYGYLHDIQQYLIHDDSDIDIYDTFEQLENHIDDKLNNTSDTVNLSSVTIAPENYDPKSWFPKNLISSDKRLKDIEGCADSDWIDFGDNHKKHIYSDFMKWYNNNCTQRDINCALGDKL